MSQEENKIVEESQEMKVEEQIEKEREEAQDTQTIETQITEIEQELTIGKKQEEKGKTEEEKVETHMEQTSGHVEITEGKNSGDEDTKGGEKEEINVKIEASSKLEIEKEASNIYETKSDEKEENTIASDQTTKIKNSEEQKEVSKKDEEKRKEIKADTNLSGIEDKSKENINIDESNEDKSDETDSEEEKDKEISSPETLLKDDIIDDSYKKEESGDVLEIAHVKDTERVEITEIESNEQTQQEECINKEEDESNAQENENTEDQKDSYNNQEEEHYVDDAQDNQTSIEDETNGVDVTSEKVDTNEEKQNTEQLDTKEVIVMEQKVEETKEQSQDEEIELQEKKEVKEKQDMPQQPDTEIELVTSEDKNERKTTETIDIEVEKDEEISEEEIKVKVEPDQNPIRRNTGISETHGQEGIISNLEQISQEVVTETKPTEDESNEQMKQMKSKAETKIETSSETIIDTKEQEKEYDEHKKECGEITETEEKEKTEIDISQVVVHTEIENINEGIRTSEEKTIEKEESLKQKEERQEEKSKDNDEESKKGKEEISQQEILQKSLYDRSDKIMKMKKRKKKKGPEILTKADDATAGKRSTRSEGELLKGKEEKSDLNAKDKKDKKEFIKNLKYGAMIELGDPDSKKSQTTVAKLMGSFDYEDDDRKFFKDEEDVEQEEQDLLFNTEASGVLPMLVEQRVEEKIEEMTPQFSEGMFVSPNDISSDEEGDGDELWQSNKTVKLGEDEKGTKSRDNWLKATDDTAKETKENIKDKKEQVSKLREITKKIDNRANEFNARFVTSPSSLNAIIEYYKGEIVKINSEIKDKSKGQRKNYITNKMIRPRDRNDLIWAKILKIEEYRPIEITKEKFDEFLRIIDVLDNILKQVRRFDIRAIKLAIGVTLVELNVSIDEILRMMKFMSKYIGENELNGIMQGATIKLSLIGKRIQYSSTLRSEKGCVTIQDIANSKIKIGEEEFKTKPLLQHTVMSRILDYEHNNDVINEIIKSTKIIVFDTPNMNKSMNLSIEDIDLLTDIFNRFGLTTINIAENENIGLEKALVNIVIDQDEHDDIITLLYSYAYNAVILTNDKHKEFDNIIRCCEVHRNVMIRKNETCHNKDNTCIIRSIKLSESRYMSIKTMTRTDKGAKITFDAPLIRFRHKRKQGTRLAVVNNMDKGLDDVILARRKVKGVNTWMTLIRNPESSLNFCVTSLAIDELNITIADYGKYSSIAHVINSITNEQRDKIMKMDLITLTSDSLGRLKAIPPNSSSINIDETKDFVTRLRHKTNVRFISHIFKSDETQILTHNKDNIYKDYEEFTNRINCIGAVITSKSMINHKLSLIKLRGEIVLVKVTDEFCKCIMERNIEAVSDISTSSINLLGSTIADNQTITLYLNRGILLKHEDQTKAFDSTNKNIFNHMLLGPPLERQVANIGEKERDMMVNLQDEYMEISNETVEMLEKRGKNKPVYYDASTSMMYYEMSTIGYQDWELASDIRQNRMMNLMKNRSKKVYIKQKKYRGISILKPEEDDFVSPEIPLAKLRLMIKRSNLRQDGSISYQDPNWRNYLSSAYYDQYIPKEHVIEGTGLYDDIPKIIYDQTLGDIISSCNGIHRKDAKLILESFQTYGTTLINKILIDMNSCLSTLMGKNRPLALPPFTWSYEDKNLKMKDSKLRMLALLKVKTEDYIVDVWFWIYTKTIATIRFKPGYFTLLPAVAMMYGNSFKNLPRFDSGLKMDTDVQFSMFKNIRTVLAHEEMYRDYFKVFAMPMRLMGLNPIPDMVSYEPVIVGNVVTEYVKATNVGNYWRDEGEERKEDIASIIMNEDSDEKYHANALQREMKDGKIFISKEIHTLVDALVTARHLMMYEHTTYKYLTMFRPIFRWEDIIKHLKICYGCDINDNVEFKEVVELIDNNPFLNSDKCLCPHCEMDIQYQDVQAVSQIGTKSVINTSKSVFYVTTDKQVEITRFKTFKQDWITCDIPIMGKYTLLKFSIGKRRTRFERYNIVVNLINSRKDMIVTEYEPYIGTDTNICQLISDCIHTHFKKERDIIIIGTDTLGSVIKKYSDVINVSKKYRRHLYIPDMLLYNSVRSKITIIDDLEKILDVEDNFEYDDSYKRIRGKNKIVKDKAKQSDDKNQNIKNPKLANIFKDKTKRTIYLITLLIVVLISILVPYNYNIIKVIIYVVFEVTNRTGVIAFLPNFVNILMKWSTIISIIGAISFATNNMIVNIIDYLFKIKAKI